MDVPWLERLDLFRYALCAAACAGVVCPLVGAFLLVRRASFHGIALPQFATAGVLCGFVVLPAWIEHVGLGGLSVEQALGDSHAALTWHLVWAALFTFGGLALLLAASARTREREVAHVAAAFAVASAAIWILGRWSPVGKSLVDELLAGEILGVGVHELETLAAAYAVLGVLLCVFHRDLLLASYDAETARVLGKRVLLLDGLATVITGVCVSVGTLILGPTLVFGLLVVPPLAARAWARSMASFMLLSVMLGLLAVAGGVVASFELDLPLGAAIVGAAALALLPGAFLARGRA